VKVGHRPERLQRFDNGRPLNLALPLIRDTCPWRRKRLWLRSARQRLQLKPPQQCVGEPFVVRRSIRRDPH
jgi:hypothetical protein